MQMNYNTHNRTWSCSLVSVSVLAIYNCAHPAAFCSIISILKISNCSTFLALLPMSEFCGSNRSATVSVPGVLHGKEQTSAVQTLRKQHSSGQWRHEKKDRQPSPEPVTYAQTRSFSHASYGISHAPLSHVTAYVPVTAVTLAHKWRCGTREPSK